VVIIKCQNKFDCSQRSDNYWIVSEWSAVGARLVTQRLSWLILPG
jgi:hypothetical protein